MPRPHGHAPDDGSRRLGAGRRRVQVFTAGEAMQTEDDDEDTDRSEEYSDDGRVSG